MCVCVCDSHTRTAMQKERRRESEWWRSWRKSVAPPNTNTPCTRGLHDNNKKNVERTGKNTARWAEPCHWLLSAVAMENKKPSKKWRSCNCRPILQGCCTLLFLPLSLPLVSVALRYFQEKNNNPELNLRATYLAELARKIKKIKIWRNRRRTATTNKEKDYEYFQGGRRNKKTKQKQLPLWNAAFTLLWFR